MKTITISLQLVNLSIKYPMGVLEDVPIKVRDLYVLVGFVILEMEEDTHVSSFLGGLSWPQLGIILI